MGEHRDAAVAGGQEAGEGSTPFQEAGKRRWGTEVQRWSMALDGQTKLNLKLKNNLSK